MGWSLPEHLAMVSGWSAVCGSPTDAISCHSSIDMKYRPIPDAAGHYPWTDLTYLLARHGVSWGYFVQTGTQPDCAGGAMACAPHTQNAHTPGIWNPLPHFQESTRTASW